jgi:hypothetical protein
MMIMVYRTNGFESPNITYTTVDTEEQAWESAANMVYKGTRGQTVGLGVIMHSYRMGPCHVLWHGIGMGPGDIQYGICFAPRFAHS